MGLFANDHSSLLEEYLSVWVKCRQMPVVATREALARTEAGKTISRTATVCPERAIIHAS